MLSASASASSASASVNASSASASVNASFTVVVRRLRVIAAMIDPAWNFP